jgi:glycosyltransferase involved in cell wall biosynthesis
MSELKGDAPPLRISVLSQIDPATPRTNSIADLRLCWGLAAQGHNVELVAPASATPRPSSSELLANYGLEPSFEVRYISTAGGSGGRQLRAGLALLGQHTLRAVRGTETRVVISRDPKLLLPYVAATFTGARDFLTAPWLHEFRDRRLERLACSRSTCVLATNSAILNDLSSRGISNPRTFVTGNAVPRERVEFGRTCSRADARGRLGLDLNRPVIAYTGKLYLGMRELEYLLAAASRLPDWLFLFTGGQPPVIERLQERTRETATTNVRFAGLLSKPEETRFYQQAADVLVAYYSVEDHPYAHHNLPNKLAEYMTTGNVIVAADFPPVRDLLNPENAMLVKPDDVDALTDALSFAVRSKDESAALADRAQRDVAARTTESVGADLSGFLVRVSSASRDI